MNESLDLTMAPPRKRPELMAPAGDWDCAKAAVENGADAIYFGLQDGLNARARAVNFAAGELPELMAFLHERGVRGYVTLNTLIFSAELAEAERIARTVIAAGVDAVLVQDLGLLRLLHRLCPELPLHASTQMTLGSAESIRAVVPLGVRRVVLPRELSLAEIAAIHRQVDVELEVFVHGALCISYSGQCLASLALGGRSANRGQCAQPCRLPYELLCDGQPVPLGERKHLLSPHDLAAYERLPELLAAGVAAVKIEGRLKTAEYVAAAAQFYRRAIDAAVETGRVAVDADGLAALELAFSRGFCRGWLDGPAPRALVSGRDAAKRGVRLGRVEGVTGARVRVRLEGPLARGDGVVFVGEKDDAAEQGGRVYEIFRQRRAVAAAEDGVVELAFGNDALDLRQVCPGQILWKTDDPQLSRRLRKSFGGPSRRSVPLDVVVEAAVGAPLRITASAATGAQCCVESPAPLAEAMKHAVTAEMLTEQLGRLGHTAYGLRRMDARISGRPMIPLSVLGQMRRAILEQLEAAAARPAAYDLPAESVVAQLRRADEAAPAAQDAVQVHVLCRTLPHVAAALDCGATRIVADFRDLADFREAVRLVRRRFGAICVATPRIHRPGEDDVLRRLADLGADGLLVRHLAGLAFCREQGLPAAADFSLNAVNELTTAWLLARGVTRVTAAYDANVEQALALAAATPPARMEVVVYRHAPLFHTAYCAFCAWLSAGRERADCGQPCRRHEVRLRDRMGAAHLLTADSQCRNTLFHAAPTSWMNDMRRLLRGGVRHFRVELLGTETAENVHRIVQRALAEVAER